MKTVLIAVGILALAGCEKQSKCPFPVFDEYEDYGACLRSASCSLSPKQIKRYHEEERDCKDGETP